MARHGLISLRSGRNHKRWLSELLPERVHRMQYFGVADDPGFNPLFSRKVDERESNEDGEDTLPG